MDSHTSPDNLLESFTLQRRVKDHWPEIIHNQTSIHEKYVLPRMEKRWQDLISERAKLFEEMKGLQDRIDWLKQFPQRVSSDRFSEAQKAERKQRSVELRAKSNEHTEKSQKLHYVEEEFKTLHDTYIRIMESYFRQLSTQILQRFPREIRDMCYEYILDESTVQVISTELRYQVDSTLHYARIPLPWPQKTSHLINPLCTHIAVTAELLDMLSKKQLPLEKISPKHPGDINRILDADPYGVGVRASAFYGDLELCWQFTDRTNGAKRHRNKNPSVLVFGDESVAEIRDILLRIVHGRDHGITIRFTIDDFPQNGMDKLLPTLNELKRRGFGFVEFYTKKQGTPWECHLDWDRDTEMISDEEMSDAEWTVECTATNHATYQSFPVLGESGLNEYFVLPVQSGYSE